MLPYLFLAQGTKAYITAQRHFDDFNSSNETRQLPTACLELGQGGAVEMGGNARKQGVALNEGPPKKSPRIRALLKLV